MDKLNALKGVKRTNVKPQYDKYALPNGRTIHLKGSATAPAGVRDTPSRTRG